MSDAEKDVQPVVNAGESLEVRTDESNSSEKASSPISSGGYGSTSGGYGSTVEGGYGAAAADPPRSVYGGVPPAREQDEELSGKLFIGGLSWQTTRDGLRYHFEKFGELQDAALMTDKRTGQPKGFGFVKFKDPAAAENVLTQEHTIDGRVVDVKAAVGRDQAPAPTRQLNTKIFVGGLASETSEREFKMYFETFGPVKDAVVMFDRNTNRSRGFGFVTFEREDTCNEVVAGSHDLGGKWVDVKRAEPLHSKGLENSTHGGIRGVMATGGGRYGPTAGGGSGHSGAYGPGGGSQGGMGMGMAGGGMGGPMGMGMMANPQMMAMRAAMTNMMQRGGYGSMGAMMQGMAGGYGGRGGYGGGYSGQPGTGGTEGMGVTPGEHAKHSTEGADERSPRSPEAASDGQDQSSSHQQPQGYRPPGYGGMTAYGGYGGQRGYGGGGYGSHGGYGGGRGGYGGGGGAYGGDRDGGYGGGDRGRETRERGGGGGGGGGYGSYGGRERGRDARGRNDRGYRPY